MIFKHSHIVKNQGVKGKHIRVTTKFHDAETLEKLLKC